MVCLEAGETVEQPSVSNEIKDGTVSHMPIESSSSSGSETGNKSNEKRGP